MAQSQSAIANYCCVATVPNDRVAYIERCGKFSRTASSGLNPICCCTGEAIAGSLSLRVETVDVLCETKTKDNVFVICSLVIQICVRPSDFYAAFYALADPKAQIISFANDSVRSTVPKIDLDSLYDSKDDIANAVKRDLSLVMPNYGYDILQTLVTDITPNAKVKAAMNEINAAQRYRVAASDKAEAEKILVVKAAEADAESKYLAGVGIARQRQAIVQGLRESVVDFTDGVSEVSASAVMELMLLTQHLDMLKEVGSQSHATTVFVPSNSGSALAELRNGFMQSQAAGLQAGGPRVQDMARGRLGDQ